MDLRVHVGKVCSILSGDGHLPQLQLHSSAIQQYSGGFIVDALTKREGRQRRVSDKWIHQVGQHQSRQQ